MKLISVKLTYSYTMYMDYEEYLETKEAFNSLNLDYRAEVVTDKMYKIEWYDYIDEEWRNIWCAEDDYKVKIKEVINAGVKFNVKIYNE